MGGLKNFVSRRKSQKENSEFDLGHEEEYEVEIWYASVAWQGPTRIEEQSRSEEGNFFQRNFSRSSSPDAVVVASAQVDGFYGQMGEKAAETILTKSHHLEVRERTVKSKASGVASRVVALPVYHEGTGGAVIHTVVADSKVSRRSLLAILHRMSQLVRDSATWLSTAGPPSNGIEPMSLQSQLGVKLHSLLSLQRIEMLKERVEQVKQIMIQNVELAMEREGKLQEIRAKAEGLSETAQLFQRKSRALKRHYWLQRVKLGAAVVTGVVVSVGIVVLPLIFI